MPRRATLHVIRRCFEDAGVEFIDENGEGPGLRLKEMAEKGRVLLAENGLRDGLKNLGKLASFRIIGDPPAAHVDSIEGSPFTKRSQTSEANTYFYMR